MTEFPSATSRSVHNADEVSRRRRCRRKRWAPRLLSCLVITAYATVASAETGDTETAVMALDRQATEMFEAEDFQQALEALEAAQQLLPNTVRVYNIAVCQERLGDLSGALISYRTFLDESDDDEERRGEALARIERLRHLLDQSEEPVSFTADSWSESREPTERRRLSPVIFYALLGVTAATGVGLIASGAVSLNYQSDFEDTVIGSAEGNAVREQGEPWVVASNVLLGLTAACAVATLVVALFTRWRRDREARNSLRLALNL